MSSVRLLLLCVSHGLNQQSRGKIVKGAKLPKPQREKKKKMMMMKWRKEGLQEEEEGKEKTTVAAVQTEESKGYISLTLFLSFFFKTVAVRLLASKTRESHAPLRVLSC